MSPSVRRVGVETMDLKKKKLAVRDLSTGKTYTEVYIYYYIFYYVSTMVISGKINRGAAGTRSVKGLSGKKIVVLTQIMQ